MTKKKLTAFTYVYKVVLAMTLLTLLWTGLAGAVTLFDNTTFGRYNSSLGTVLDCGSACGNLFPLVNNTSGDPTITGTAEPNLSAAAAILGSLLGNPPTFNTNWSSGPVAIPSTWAINTETAIVYIIDAGAGVTNVSASLGVDNGIYVWLDGVFQFGALAPGGASAGEYNVNLGDLSGTHFLQILREDHGGFTDYDISVTGDARPVPEPSTLLLLGAGLFGLPSVLHWRK